MTELTDLFSGLAGLLKIPYEPFLYVFLFGLIYFITYYLMNYDSFLKENWKDMESFDKILFIFLCGVNICLPPFLLSINVVLISWIWHILYQHYQSQ